MKGPMMGVRHYLLGDDGTPYELPDDEDGMLEFMLRWPGQRAILQEDVAGVLVSTIFLGLDHSFWGDAPILFETMWFSDYGSECRRYQTRAEALEGHKAVVEALRAKGASVALPAAPGGVL